ncbi:TadE family type IV pilus minor pilin [Mycobacterium sp. PS03-16]|uniref:TadE family type IV pilus minor pilin n=1 Tax=Mycobacterium sp. PS03-16 TaxID=2559611 RepID=UPI001FD75021|nr:TadE family type IV pilus minor pilin [Mycobacterium sp. PS03-16]
MAALVVVVALCVAGLSAIAAQVRWLDAAREAARLAARGDQSATAAARGVAPAGAAVEIRWEGDLVVARVTARAALLPGVEIAARAVAAAEPGVR